MITFRLKAEGQRDKDLIGLALTADDVVGLMQGSDLVIPAASFGCGNPEIIIHYAPSTNDLITRIAKAFPDIEGQLRSAAEKVEADGQMRIIAASRGPKGGAK